MFNSFSIVSTNNWFNKGDKEVVCLQFGDRNSGEFKMLTNVI